MVPIAVVAALGNPGPEYRDTRHNVGWFVVDALVEKLGGRWERLRRFQAELATVEVAGRRVHCLKPLTFMNLSGESVAPFCRFHRLPPEAVAAVVDEVQLAVGAVKVSVGGGTGGHNGVESLIAHLGPAFARFRVGVGARAHAGMSLADHVLGTFSPEERAVLDQRRPALADGLLLLVEKGAATAMNRLNSRERRPSVHDPDPPVQEA